MKRIITVLLLVAAARTANGQQTQDTVELREIVATATRMHTPRVEVSAAVTIIYGDDMRRRGIRTVDEVMRSVSGAVVVQSGSYGASSSLFLRGGESDYVQVLIDGVQVNSPGEQFNWNSLAIEDIERIEIVKGPSSVLYGSDAVTGVVQLFTKQRSGKPRAELAVAAGRGQKVGAQADGAFDNTTVRGEIAGAAGALLYSAGVSHFATEGAYAFNNRHRNTSVTTRAVWRADPRTSLSGSVRYGRNRFHYPTDGTGQLTDRNQYREGETVAAGLEFSRKFSSRLEGHASVGVNDNDAVNEDASDNPADTIGFYRFHLAERFRRHATDLHVNYRIASSSVVTAGTEFEWQSNHASSASPFGDQREQSETRNNRAAYAQLFSTFGRLSVQAGVRGEDNEKFGNFATYRGGVSSQLTHTLRVRAAAGTSFKEPRFFEQFAQGFVIGNPALSPERSRSIEGGLDAVFSKVTLSASYFAQKFSDLIQYLGAPANPGDPNYFNLAAARANGLELDARWSAHPFTMTANYTNLDTRVIDSGTGDDPSFAAGQTLLRRPHHSGAVAIAANSERASINLSAHYVGERADLDFASFPAGRVDLPDYTRVDLGVEYGITRSARATLKIENAFDAKYQEVLNFPATGRVAYFGMRIGR